MKASERLFLTADRKTAVKDGDKRAVYLLAGKGQELPDVVVKLYKLKKQAKKPANKMISGIADKSKKKTEEK